ncbi:hypothetical protein SAMN05216481_11711 [Streptomyces radiopugnans]|uniref:Uncharacterized protein n=1 Tax=Streptomyces radiopugnans TaxID=403935 RepID=A0A1H9JBM3_9ACTN|nr:hypothetical protein SAMN05216481_11711 [Streptomyces radiopugnans]
MVGGHGVQIDAPAGPVSGWCAVVGVEEGELFGPCGRPVCGGAVQRAAGAAGGAQPCGEHGGGGGAVVAQRNTGDRPLPHCQRQAGQGRAGLWSLVRAGGWVCRGWEVVPGPAGGVEAALGAGAARCRGFGDVGAVRGQRGVHDSLVQAGFAAGAPTELSVSMSTPASAARCCTSTPRCWAVSKNWRLTSSPASNGPKARAGSARPKASTSRSPSCASNAKRPSDKSDAHRFTSASPSSGQGVTPECDGWGSQTVVPLPNGLACGFFPRWFRGYGLLPCRRGPLGLRGGAQSAHLRPPPSAGRANRPG